MGKGNAEIEEKPDNEKRKNVLFFNFGSLLMFISEFFKKTQTHICWLMEKYGLRLFLLGHGKMFRQQKKTRSLIETGRSSKI